MTVDQDVGWFDISVDHAVEVSVLKSISDLSNPANGLLRCRWVVDEVVAKTATLNKLRHDEAVIPVPADIEHLHHTGMLDSGDTTGLSHEGVGREET